MALTGDHVTMPVPSPTQLREHLNLTRCKRDTAGPEWDVAVSLCQEEQRKARGWGEVVGETIIFPISFTELVQSLNFVNAYEIGYLWGFCKLDAA